MKKTLVLFALMLGSFFALSGCENEISPITKTESYIVTYNLVQGNEFLKQTVIAGEKALVPPIPSKEDYIFEYWTLESEEFSFNQSITSNIVLYAKWSEKKVEIKLYDNQTLIEILKLSINTPSLTLINYSIPGPDEEFLGWFIDNELTTTLDSNATISEDLILYGKWKQADETKPIVDNGILEDGLYTSKDEVALYITTFHKLPSNYMTKSEAGGSNGSNIINIWTEANKCSIGGDLFGNREGLLPTLSGRTFTELDIDYNGSSRGTRRIVYSSDFRIFYTGDHYDSFVEYDKETGEWNSY
jgi:uncharacterized repeat protein (TIGR02543 family)